MKKIIFILITFIIIIFDLTFIIEKKQTFSENENRYLAQIPKLSIKKIYNQEFMTELSDYIGDQFPNREKLLSIKTQFLKLLGNNKINDIYIANDGYLIKEYTSSTEKEKIINILNKFSSTLKNINIDIIIAPTSTSIYSKKLPPNNISDSQEDDIEFYKENLNMNFIDITDTLKNYNYNNIYYKTDHHWNMYGSYYAYTKYCKVKEIKCNNYSIYSVSNNFLGTYYSKILDNSQQEENIYRIDPYSNYSYYIGNKKYSSIYFEEWLNKKDKYNYYLNGNNSISYITNNEMKEKNEILIIKDSYANNFIPYLIDNYSKITIIDPRYYKDSIITYIQNNNINNILLLYNIDTIEDDLGIRTINRK